MEYNETELSLITNTRTGLYPSERKLVSAIVPIYNEEKTLEKVINTLIKNTLIDEVVCVNDGSTDKSSEILNKFKNKIVIVNIKGNRGKGNALAQGIRKTKGEIVAFFDADLINLSDSYIQILLAPILGGYAKAVLGYPSSDSIFPELISGYTGERAYYKRDLIPHLHKMAKTGFGVEVYLNRNFEKGQTIKVPLKGLAGPYKHQKHESSIAFKEYMSEATEITVELAKSRIIKAEDYKIIKNLNRITTLPEFKFYVKKINDKMLKDVLEKYILKYLQAIYKQ